MTQPKLKVEYLPAADLAAYANNTRTHSDEQVDEIAASIDQFKFSDPIGVWTNREGVLEVVEGHGRLMAARRLGIEQVPVIRLDHLDDDARRAYSIVHNSTTDHSQFDFGILEREIGSMPEFDWDSFGLDEFAFDLEGLDTGDGLKDVIEDDLPESAPERVKRGQVWQLGRHRLMCGDSTDPAVIDRLMDGVKADMVFTDPPYGMKKEKDGVLNDNLNYDDLLDFNRQWIPLTFGALKDNGSWYCWGIDEPLMDIYSNILKPMARENKITFRNLITWDKGNGQGQLSEDFRMYPIADEKCLFVMCGEQDMRFKRNLEEFNEMFEPIRKWFEDERKKSGLSVEQISKIDSTRCSHYWAKVQFEFPTKEAFCKIQTYCINNGINAFDKEYEEIKKEYEEIKKEFYKNRAYFDNTHDNQNNVWHFDRAGKDEREHTGGHATPKPIALCSRAIKSSSREGEIVLDVFGGSGSTLITCEQLSRTCYMMELDPHYCDVIIERWERFTGKCAELLG